MNIISYMDGNIKTETTLINVNIQVVLFLFHKKTTKNNSMATL